MKESERNKEVMRLEIALNEIEHQRFKIIESLERLGWDGWQDGNIEHKEQLK